MAQQVKIELGMTIGGIKMPLGIAVEITNKVMEVYKTEEELKEYMLSIIASMGKSILDNIKLQIPDKDEVEYHLTTVE